MKKNKNKIVFNSFIIVYMVSVNMLWASADIPMEESTIDGPPDTVPIDNYLPWALFLMVVMIGCFFSRRAKSLQNNK